MPSMSDRLYKPLTGQYGFLLDADRLATLANLGLSAVVSDKEIILTDAEADPDSQKFSIKSDTGGLVVSSVSDDGETYGGIATFSGSGVNAVADFAGNVEIRKNLWAPIATTKLAGRATLASGTVTVADTSVTASDAIVATAGFALAGRLYVTINAGVGFTITSTTSEAGAVSWVKIHLV